MKILILSCMILAAVLLSRPAGASTAAGGFELSVLTGGEPRPEYAARGTVYVEALRGREYVLRISNPLPSRVAVALSVDGLNTIDARRTDAWSARKWVLEPYGSMVVPGWQVDGSTARSFYFTGERHSYGVWLGKTENLGVIEAVFFRENLPRPVLRPHREDRAPGELENDAAGQAGAPDGMARPLAAQAPEASGSAGPRAERKLAKPAPSLSDEYAATGMGGRTGNEVETVSLELDRTPVATVRLRYEFRAQLVKLGVLPRWPTPLERREGASGFAVGYCPQPSQ